MPSPAQAKGSILKAAVADFDSWTQDLGVQTFDAIVGLLATPAAPAALRSLALQCAAQEPLVLRVAFLTDEDDGCARKSCGCTCAMCAGPGAAFRAPAAHV